MGPNRYLRTTGNPNAYSSTFLAIPGQGELQIKNGDPDGKHRVSSALIYINGIRVMGVEAFSKKAYKIVLPITLYDNNSISVELRSKPESYFEIKLIQQVLAEAASIIGPEGGEVEVMNSSSELFGAKIEIFPETIGQNALIKISGTQNLPSSLPANLSRNSQVFVLESSGVFNGLASVTLPYDSPTSSGDFLAVAYFDENTNIWQLIPILLNDRNLKKVTFLTNHFSIFVVVKIPINPPSSVKTDFNIKTDSMSYENNDFYYCPEYGNGENEGVCAGVAYFSQWYYKNFGHGLTCYYDWDKAEKVSCDSMHEFRSLRQTLNKLYGLGSLPRNIIDQCSAKESIINGLKSGSPQMLGMTGWLTGHMILAVAWEQLNSNSGVFRCYDVNNNSNLIDVYVSSARVVPCGFYSPDYPEMYFFTAWPDWNLDLSQIKNKYEPDNPDSDGDGVRGSCDNCLTISNPDQSDSNGNGIGDACETPAPIPGIVNLPKTGQTACYDELGNLIGCAGTGQDGEIQAGVAWPSPRFTDHGEGTMTDNLTGLMWTKDANLPGAPKKWQEALDYVVGMNSGSYPNFGYNDWRLPNVVELESLVIQVASAMELNRQGFLNFPLTAWYDYWSSTTAARCYPDRAFVVGTDYSAIAVKAEYNGFVWPVREITSGPAKLWKTGQEVTYAPGDDGDLESGIEWPSPRFLANPDSTITDALTSLIWASDATTPAVGSYIGGIKTWQGALDYIKCLNLNSYLGYSDWRLPNVIEQISLNDYSNCFPSLPFDHPFKIPEGSFWSSTSAVDASNTWGGLSKLWDTMYVWPVRGGLNR